MNWTINILLAVLVGLLIAQYIRLKTYGRRMKERERFFGEMAHDICNHIALINAPLKELESQHNLTAYNHESLNIALSNTERINTTVCQLFEIQRIIEGADRNQWDYCNIYVYLQDKVQQYKILADAKGLKLQLEIASNFPSICLDKSKMDRILDNLVSNAIKYTEKGGVHITCSFLKYKWIIEVKDTGIGIPLVEQKHIFKLYYRATNAIQTNEMGSGVGLVVVKELVKQHKGTLRFQSKQNLGSTFTISFPIPKLSKQPTNPNQSQNVSVLPLSPPISNHEKATVLLVEDNEDMREYLLNALSSDYSIVCAEDGLQALEVAKEQNPDLIISDVLMPRMRGDELCRILKSSIETSHIPLVLLTALSEKEDILSGLEAGANDYIVKPFDLAVLKARIRTIMQNREQLRQMVLSSEIMPEELDYANQLDKEFLDKAMAVIEAEIDNPTFSINDFCRAVAMSRTSVYNKIKTLTGQGPNDFIRIIRLNKAKDLLLSKRYSVSDVSVMVGFSDAKYFSTCFKKQFGISPSKIE